MFEEDSGEKIKKILKIGGGLIFSFILIFIIVKTFILKPSKPPSPVIPPQEIEEIKVKWPEKERVKVKKNVFLRLIKIEDYVLEDIKPAEGFKFLSLEIELENKSSEAIRFPSFSQLWKIISIDGESYYPFYPWLWTPPAPLNPNLRKPALFSSEKFKEELAPESIERGYISFEVPKEILIKEVIFQTEEKKFIFEILPRSSIGRAAAS